MAKDVQGVPRVRDPFGVAARIADAHEPVIVNKVAVCRVGEIDQAVTSPTGTHQILGFANLNGLGLAKADLLQLPARVKANPLTIWRKERRRGTLGALQLSGLAL